MVIGLVIIDKLNMTRKVDSMGRIYIPKMLRDRAGINGDTEVNLYYIQEDDGMYREFIGVGALGASARTGTNNKYETAIEALQELKIPIPQALFEKYRETLVTEAEKIEMREMDKKELSREKRRIKKALNTERVEEEEKVNVAPAR